MMFSDGDSTCFFPKRKGKGCACASCKATCGCRVCLDEANVPDWLRGMILCATCGNKRCPHATDHRLDCTGSNEPGQRGSDYE